MAFANWKWDTDDGHTGYVGWPIIERENTLQKIVGDLVAFGLARGYNEAAIKSAIEDLFRTFITQWVLYVYTGASDLATAINANTTLAWLNQTSGGLTIRQRLVNRLS